MSAVMSCAPEHVGQQASKNSIPRDLVEMVQDEADTWYAMLESGGLRAQAEATVVANIGRQLKRQSDRVNFQKYNVQLASVFSAQVVENRPNPGEGSEKLGIEALVKLITRGDSILSYPVNQTADPWQSVARHSWNDMYLQIMQNCPIDEN